MKATLRVRKYLFLAGVFSVMAGAAHGALTQEHLREWRLFGLFFAAAGLAQAAFGMVLFVQIALEKCKVTRAMRTLYILGIAGNLSLIGLYAVSRTLGVPAPGPSGGFELDVEDITTAGLLTKVFESLTVLYLASIIRTSGRTGKYTGGRLRVSVRPVPPSPHLRRQIRRHRPARAVLRVLHVPLHPLLEGGVAGHPVLQMPLTV